jgi:sec-independent protein translocase protein TatA
MFRLGPWEIGGIVLIILLLFGPGRIVKVAGELGQGMRTFRDNLVDKKDQSPTDEDKEEKK